MFISYSCIISIPFSDWYWNSPLCPARCQIHHSSSSAVVHTSLLSTVRREQIGIGLGTVLRLKLLRSPQLKFHPGAQCLPSGSLCAPGTQSRDALDLRPLTPHQSEQLIRITLILVILDLKISFLAFNSQLKLYYVTIQIYIYFFLLYHRNFQTVS